MKKFFTNIIEERRKELRMTKTDIANKLEISRTTYFHYESGKRRPSIEIIIKISAILDINPLNAIFSCLPNELATRKDIKKLFDNYLNCSLSKDECDLLLLYRNLDNAQKKATTSMISCINQTQQFN